MTYEERVETLIRTHLNRRPHTRAVDVYKLIYQGVFGVGHILGKDAFNRLQAEAGGLKLDEQPDEPLMEDISVDGSMIRVNLRPYMRQGLSLDKLFSAMKEPTPEKNAKEFIRIWSIFRGLVDSGRFSFDTDEIEELSRDLNSGNIPPRHHSKVYREAYNPAYRVIKLKSLVKMLGEHNKIRGN